MFLYSLRRTGWQVYMCAFPWPFERHFRRYRVGSRACFRPKLFPLPARAHLSAELRGRILMAVPLFVFQWALMLEKSRIAEELCRIWATYSALARRVSAFSVILLAPLPRPQPYFCGNSRERWALLRPTDHAKTRLRHSPSCSASNPQRPAHVVQIIPPSIVRWSFSADQIGNFGLQRGRTIHNGLETNASFSLSRSVCRRFDSGGLILGRPLTPSYIFL